MSTVSITMLNAATAVGAGDHKTPNRDEKALQASGTTTSGTGAAVVEFQGCNLATPTSPAVTGEWTTFAVIKLKLATTKDSKAILSSAPFKHVRANVASISGTGAAVSAHMGC